MISKTINCNWRKSWLSRNPLFIGSCSDIVCEADTGRSFVAVAIPSLSGHAVIWLGRSTDGARAYPCRNPLFIGSCSDIGTEMDLETFRKYGRNPLFIGSCSDIIIAALGVDDAITVAIPSLSGHAVI